MTMQQAIKEFQDNGNREIIDRVLEYTEIDFLKDKTRREVPIDERKYKVIIDLPEPEMYIAYRVRFFLDKISNYEVYYDDEDYQEYCEFMQLVDYIRDWWNLDGGKDDPPWDSPKPYINQKWDDLIEVKEDLKSYFNDMLEDWDGFFYDIDYFTKLNRKIKLEKRKKINNLKVKYITPALEYALHKVDYNRTDKEIVKYINKAFLTHFVVEQNKERGLIRLQRKVPRYRNSYDYQRDTKELQKVTRNIYVTFQYNTAIKMVLEKDISRGRMEDKVFPILQTRQIDFLEELINMVEVEIKADNRNAFKMDNDGKSILNYRYFADKLEVEESNLKHKIKRIRKKITDNWNDIAYYSLPKKHKYKTSHFHI